MKNLQAILLSAAYTSWWGYSMYSAPVEPAQPFQVQNLLIFVLIMAALSTLLIQMFVTKDIVINKQYIAWALLLSFAVLSLVWAEEAVLGFQRLKFYIALVGLGLLNINVVGSDRLNKYWIFFLLFFSFIALLHATTIIIEHGSLRLLAYDTNPNYYVLIGVVTIPIAVHIFYHSKQIPDGFAVLSIFLSVLIFVFSESRVWIPVLVTWVIGAFLVDHDRIVGWSYSKLAFPISVSLSFILFVVVVFTDAGILGRVYTRTAYEMHAFLKPLSPSDPTRVQIYKYTIHLIGEKETYLHGLGYDMFRVNFKSYVSATIGYNPHNAYLKPLLELGVVGMLLFISVIFYPFRYAISAVNSVDNTAKKSLIIALLWAYGGILIFGVFQPIRSHFQLYLLTALLYGVFIEAKNEDPHHRS